MLSISNILYVFLMLPFQASQWLTVDVQPQEGDVQTGWLLLEEAAGWENQPRGPHEAQSERGGGT